MRCLFVSDIHGNKDHYEKLFRSGFLEPALYYLRDKMGSSYPTMIMILGNDDPRATEHYFIDLEKKGLINYVNEKKIVIGSTAVYGYSYVPPTPFLLKDWEKYDISRYVPRDAVSPEEGIRTFDVAPNLVKYINISDDLRKLTEDEENIKESIFLFHSPPCDTALDLMDGNDIDGKPELKHVGSIAIRKFIEKNQPLVTLHGHIHESSSFSGSWRDKIGNTHCFTAAYNNSKLALVRFDTACLEESTRELI
jgi:uncharacterized protein